MIGKNSEQIDIFSHMIYDRLIPKNHLLVKIDSIIEFSFVYDIVKDRYSSLGRASKDPVMMVKICLMEYLYNLSDVQIIKRMETDVAANVNYPSDRKLLCNAFRKVIKEIGKFDESLATQQLELFESSIEEEYKKSEKVSIKKYLEIANKRIEYLYLKTYDELQTNERYQEAFGMLYD